MLVENNNRIDIHSFAYKFKQWVERGHEDLGDTEPIGLGMLSATMVRYPDFVDNPIEVAKIAGKLKAPNGSLMRTAIMGCRGLDYATTIDDAITMGMCTHYDERCRVSVAVLVSIVWDILNDTDESQVLDRARRWCSLYDGNFTDYRGQSHSIVDECTMYFDVGMRQSALDDLHLGVQCGYTLKCMAVAVWAFTQRHRPYKDVILDIILKGGDTDTNGAAAGAVLGAYRGVDDMPKEWLDKLAHKDYLEEKIDLFKDIL